ncbi:unnamed protein product [Brachionus calyciflorus]|uniref:Uncharacterized protein n=1 Tax=Brachionus calyciflorus TaxID=104777 RepID=A0A813TB67_9BILA|nr:unnamed protein product [Brachionus calyciflorus]
MNSILGCNTVTAWKSDFTVQSINGIDITNSYKVPNIAQITKIKNAGSSGRKRKGHAVNTIEPSTSKIVDDDVVSNYLTELLLIDFRDSLDKILQKKLVIKTNMVITDHKLLSDIFLKEYDFDLLVGYFIKSTWKNVKILMEDKVKHCICPIFSLVCLENSISMKF